jgi:outer membrane protein assembly factor BamB
MKYLTCFVLLIALSGTVFGQPLLDITPDPLKFGFISINGVQQRLINLANIGDQTLVLDSCLYQSPFDVNPVAGLSIAPGETILLPTRFQPDQEQYYDQTFTFYYNGSNPYTLPVTATGVRNFQPGEIIWSFQHIENVECVLAADDYNNDGIPDVVAEGYDAGASGDPLVCLSGSGISLPELIWSVHPAGGPSNSGGWGDKCLALSSDLNDDGIGDVLRGGAWGSRTVFAIDGTSGGTIWSFDTYANPPSGWIYTVNELDDMNGDGKPEIIAGAGSDANRAYCFDGATGSLRWTYIAQDAVSQVCALPDINDDGYDDVIIAAMDNSTMFQVVSGASTGSAAPIWMFNIGQSVYTACAIKDVNDDGYDDVIAGTWGRGVVAFSGHRAGQGMILWEYPLNTSVMRVVSCPDLNADGYNDVLVASWSSYALALSGVDGSEIWRFYCGDDVWAIDFIEDITGDAVVEAVAGSFTYNVELIDGALGTRIWQTPVGAKVLSVRNIGDVNGDGFEDVIAGTQYLSGSGGQVFLISGWKVEGTGIDEKSASIPQDFIVTSNYPNPFNNGTIIQFNLDREDGFELSIYDVGGRLVDRITGLGQPGINRIRWNFPEKDNVATGVYFYKLKAGDRFGQNKMLYIK